MSVARSSQHCSPVPLSTLSYHQSKPLSMEAVGHRNPSSATPAGLLVVPAPNNLVLDDLDDEDGEIVIGIRPKSSPQPRRKTSIDEDDSASEPPSCCGSRRVSFADAIGLSLVQVKEFDKWDVPQLPDYLDSTNKEEEEYFITTFNFPLRLPPEESLTKVQNQKVELESIELLAGTTILKGVIRVLNISFTKAVYVRTSLDNWVSHFDLLSEFIPGSCDGQTDSFSFKLTLVPPFGELGARVDFCLRYETSVGTFWANNSNRNYTVFCYKRKKEVQDKPHKENLNKKSCLKTVSQSFCVEESMSSPEQENSSTDVTQTGQQVNSEIQTKESTNSPPGKSEDDGCTLQMENKRNCSRRNRRKAARMARVRDIFAQRDLKTNNTENESSPETQKEPVQATETETTPEQNQDKYSDLQSASKGNITLEDTADASLSNDSAPKSKTEKYESTNPADKATSTTISHDDSKVLSNAELASGPNINKFVPSREEKGEEPTNMCECTKTSREEGDSKGLVSNFNSGYAFGTVVAPLYHQVSGKVKSDAGTLSHIEIHGPMSTNDQQERDQEIQCNCEDIVLCSNDEKEVESRVKSNVENQDVNELENSDQISTVDSLPMQSSTIAKSHNESVLICDLLHGQGNSNDPIREMQECSDNDTNDNENTIVQVDGQSLLCNFSNMDKDLIIESEDQEHTFDLENSSQLEPSCLTNQPTNESNMDEQNHVNVCSEEENVSLSQNEHLSGEPTDTSNLTDEVTSDHDDKMLAFLTHDANVDPEEGNISLSPQQMDAFQDQVSNNSEFIDDATMTASPSNLSISTKENPPLSIQLSQNQAIHLVDQPTNTSDLLSEPALVQDVGKIISVDKSSSEETKLNAHNEFNAQEIMPSSDFGFEALKEQDADTDTDNIGIEGVGEVDEQQAEPNNVWIESDTLNKAEVEDVVKDENIAVTENMEEFESQINITDINLEDGANNWEVMVEEEEDSIEDLILENEDEMLDFVPNMVEDNILENSEMAEARNSNKLLQMAVGSILEEVEDEKNDIHMQENELNITLETVMFHEMYFEQAMESEMPGICTNNEENKGAIDRKMVPQEDRNNAKCIDLNEKELKKSVMSNTLVSMEKMPDFHFTNVDSTEKSDIKIQLNSGEEESALERLDTITPHKVDCNLSTPVNNVQEDFQNSRQDTAEVKTDRPIEIAVGKKENFHSNIETNDWFGSASEMIQSSFAELKGEDFSDDDSNVSESDSEDEMELYMHCLRAVYGQQSSPKATRPEQNKEIHSGKRLSITRSKLLSTSLPSISESVDEDQQCNTQHIEIETVDLQPIAEDLPDISYKEETISPKYLWWKNTFSCSNILKTLLYATLVLVFLAVAYHYDFIACFGLYLISVVWLFFQGDRQTGKNNRVS